MILMFIVFLWTADQPGSYDHIIVNDDIDAAYGHLKQVAVAVSTSSNTCFVIKIFARLQQGLIYINFIIIKS